MSAEVSFQSLFRHPSIQRFNPYSKAVFADLPACHTAAKGYHITECDLDGSGNRALRYHGCGNRHCPNCGSMKRDVWIEGRMDELLPTVYYHIVFTLPHELNPVIMGNRNGLFDTLFHAASQTLLRHAKMPEYLEAEPGITMVLHIPIRYAISLKIKNCTIPLALILEYGTGSGVRIFPSIRIACPAPQDPLHRQCRRDGR